MKSVFVICALLCVSLVAADLCADGRSYCPGAQTCCWSRTVYKCSPFARAVCCPGGDYSCPSGKSCLKVSSYYVCVGRSTTKIADKLSGKKQFPEFLVGEANPNQDSSIDQKV